MDPAVWEQGQQLWEVVGGVQKGGILVRVGEATTSQELPDRLSCGAWVREERLSGQRLRYRRLTGSGPETGWVSLRLKDQDLLVRRGVAPPGMDYAAAVALRDLTAPGAVLQGGELLAAIFRQLELPWAGASVAAACRAWRSCLGGNALCWTKLGLRERRHVPALGGLLQRAGARLRVLDLSGVRGRDLGTLPELAIALRSCSNLEDLNVAGWDQLSFAKSPDLQAALARSLCRLNIRGCSVLHVQLPAMLGAKLQHLEAGWLGEADEERVWSEWTRIFPSHIFQHICRRCPSLRVLRFPGYTLYSGQPESTVVALLNEYADIGRVGSLRQLLRLDLSCAQLLEDPAVVKIATGCKQLRSLGLRCCENVTDRGLTAVADNLGNSLVHINISCCQFSERVVRRLIIRCRGLRTLDLCYCRGLGPGLVGYLCADPALCPQLRMIGAGGLDLGDEEIRAMCRKYTQTLEHLGIGAAARLTDAGLRALAALPRLRRLSAHQLQRISVPGLISLCLDAPRLTDVDAENCEFSPTPGPSELEALQKCLKDRVYDYNVCDDESDSEEAEKEMLRREREEKEKAARERRKKDKVENDSQSLLLAMESEMSSLPM